jgi:peptidylprolyl isomerase
MIKNVLVLLFVISSFSLSSCDSTSTYFYEPDFTTVPAAFPRADSAKTVLPNGLIIYEVKTGDGPFTVQNKDVINGYYTGRKLSNDEIFDSTYKDGFTNYFSLNLGGVNANSGSFNFIQGFRQGFVGMKKGGQRVIVIPPDLGYAGTGNILASDTLVFDIEVHSFVSAKK